MNLQFTVIMDDIETIEGIGEVVRVEDDPPGMGVVFTQLSHYSQHLLEQAADPPRVARVRSLAPGATFASARRAPMSRARDPPHADAAYSRVNIALARLLLG